MLQIQHTNTLKGYILIAVNEEKKAQLISAAIEFICGSSCTVQDLRGDMRTSAPGSRLTRLSHRGRDGPMGDVSTGSGSGKLQIYCKEVFIWQLISEKRQ